MHDTYTTESGKVKRRSESAEKDIEPDEALKTYRGVVLRIERLQEDLEEALEREAAMRPAIKDLINELLEHADATENVGDHLVEEAEGKFREARLALKRMDEARDRSSDEGEG